MIPHPSTWKWPDSKRAAWALCTGLLFGLLLPGWATIPTYLLATGVITGVIIMTIAMKSARIDEPSLGVMSRIR